MAQLCAVLLATFLANSASAAYVQDSLDGTALLQVHGLGHDLQTSEVMSSIPIRPIPVWVWQVYGAQPTAIQTACLSSWRRHAPPRFFDVRFVNRHTISEYLPGLPAGFWRLPTEEDKSHVAVAGLLARHGGIHLDSDVLLRGDLIDTVEHLSSADVVSFAANGQTCGKHALSSSFMVARNKSALARRWYEMAADLLSKPCTTDAKACCVDKWGEDLKQCKVTQGALGERLARKALNELLMQKKSNLKVQCFENGKAQGLETCTAACLSQKMSKSSTQLVQRPTLSYKLFADAARTNLSHLNASQLRYGSQVASELIRQSLSHTVDLFLIHIPRTGGTTIESFSHLEPYPEDRWGCQNPLVQGLHKIGTSGKQCFGQHVPPNFLQVWGKKTTFCVVRNPFERVISEFSYNQGIRGNPSCNAESLNADLKSWLTAVRAGDNYLHDCHLLPQAAYVWGWDAENKKVDTSVQSCRKVLRFELFEQDFDALMVASGYQHRMEDAKHILSASEACDKLTVDDLSAEVKQAIKEVYKEDFQLLFQTGQLGDPLRK